MYCNIYIYIVLRCGDIPTEITLKDYENPLSSAPWIPGTNFSYKTCLNGIEKSSESDFTIRCILDEKGGNPVWSYGCFRGL